MTALRRNQARVSKRPAVSRRTGTGSWVRRSTLFASLVLLAVAGIGSYLWLSHGRPVRVAPLVPAGSNFLLVTIDTLRADHLPAYGYQALDTPTISRLAREGIVFRYAFTPIPLTFPAHISLLTGLLPLSHGIRDNGGYYLGSSQQTLAKLFSAHNYRTAAFVASFVLDSRRGLGQGFDHYFGNFQVTLSELGAMERLQRPAGEVWSQARSWLQAHTSDQFFLWLHFYDPHTPYAPPEPFKTRYASHPYDGEIAYADSVLGEVIASLESQAILEKTVIVVVADHGEGLGDHGEDEHGLLAYDSTLRVPWIMRFPGRSGAGTTIDRPVSLVDVFPTVVELFGFGSPGPIDGTSQVEALRGPAVDRGEMLYAETLYPRFHFGWNDLTSVRADRFKYIRAPRRELYDYRRDPGESTNVIERYPEVAERMDRILAAISQKASAGARQRPAAIEPAAEQRLRALGYVGGRQAVEPSDPGSRLADPKDKVEAYRRFMKSQQLLDEGQAEKGVELLGRLLAEEPEMEAAHRALRNYWIGRGEFRAAVSRFLAEIGRRPGQVEWLMDLGITYQAWHRPTDASDVFKKVLAVRPEHVEALKSIGQILIGQKAYSEAADYLVRAAHVASYERQWPTDEINVLIAQTHFQLGRLAEAEELLNRVLAEQPSASGAHHLLAQIAEQRGDAVRAEREYRLEVETSPWDYRARMNLASLLGQQRAIPEEIAVLESIPALAPGFSDVYFYLAKAYLDSGDPAKLVEAVAAATRGLRLAPTSATAPLGHYVLAGVYLAQGKQAEASEERRRGQALELRLGAETHR